MKNEGLRGDEGIFLWIPPPFRKPLMTAQSVAQGTSEESSTDSKEIGGDYIQSKRKANVHFYVKTFLRSLNRLICAGQANMELAF